MVDSILGCCRGDDLKPKVSLQIGKIIGSARETPKGTEYVSFVGIPYAEPPVGHLRFRRPVPVQPWIEDKPLDASKKKIPFPMQLFTELGPKLVVGQEDCLRLSIYTPDLPVTHNQAKLPVFVWLFGGDFVANSASESHYGPEYFMDCGNMVVVMVAYRVGPFGFLCLGDEYVPGNQALWDQQMALRWIHQNIAHFGGDKNLLTLAGHNAGSVCVSYHIVSPQSAGLFTNAICMSGTFISPAFTFDKDPEVVGKEFASKLGCVDKDDSVDQILNKLQNLKASEIVKEAEFLKDWDTYKPNPWLPIIDAKHVKKDPFIPESPIDLIKKGQFNKMPTIIGHTKNEGIYYTSKLLENPAALDVLDNEWEILGNIILCNKSSDEINDDDKNIIKKIKDFYHGDDTSMTKANVSTTIEMFGDFYVFGPDEYFSSLIISQSAQPVYVYSFDYHGSWRLGDYVTLSGMKLLSQIFLSCFGIKPNDANSHGVCSGDDVFYLFSSKLPHLKRIGKATPQDEMVQKKMVQLWMNFVQNSNPTPNPESDPLLKNFLWKPLATDKQHYAVIESAVEFREYDEDMLLRSNFWKKVLDEDIKYPTSFSDKPPVLNEKLYLNR